MKEAANGWSTESLCMSCGLYVPASEHHYQSCWRPELWVHEVKNTTFSICFTLVAVGTSMINKSLEKGDSQPIPTILQSKFGLRVIPECAEAYFKNLSDAKNLKTREGKNLSWTGQFRVSISLRQLENQHRKEGSPKITLSWGRHFLGLNLLSNDILAQVHFMWCWTAAHIIQTTVRAEKQA